MQDLHNDQMRTASPESIFQAQKKPSTKVIEALKEWRDKEADSEMEAEWCDAALHAARQARKEEWE